jgi:protein phosphatase
MAVYRNSGDSDPQQALVEALQAAHEQIRQYSFEHPELRGMGTTCTAAAIVQNGLYFVHVGDTRLYLIREGQITRVTRDHSYVGRLVESGMISPEEAETHPQRNILTAALGTNPELIMDLPAQPAPLLPKDVLLICSDGLWGLVRDPEILDTVDNKTVEQAGRELIELARERGGPDNITVEILRLR